jgi:hypothetical protein
MGRIISRTIFIGKILFFGLFKNKKREYAIEKAKKLHNDYIAIKQRMYELLNRPIVIDQIITPEANVQQQIREIQQYRFTHIRGNELYMPLYRLYSFITDTRYQKYLNEYKWVIQEYKALESKQRELEKEYEEKINTLQNLLVHGREMPIEKHQSSSELNQIKIENIPNADEKIYEACGLSPIPSFRKVSSWRGRKVAIKNRPKKLYYIRLKYDGNYYYKVGITTRDVESRFKSLGASDHIFIDKVLYFKQLKNAIAIEKRILKTFENHRYRNPYFLRKHGNTEIFDIDVLELDPLNP